MTEHDEAKQMWAEVFTRSSETYNQVGPDFFTPNGEKLVEYAGVTPGAKVLDVACGRGAVLLPAGRAVGVGGEVIGIDLAEGMISQINQTIDQNDAANLKALQMDAENLDFPDETFDFVLSGFGLFFLPNLPKALKGFYRVLKPGGVLAATSFETFEPAYGKDLAELNASYQDIFKPAPKVDTSGLNSVEKVTHAFDSAGFAQIECQVERFIRYFQDAEEWWQVMWSFGQRSLLERIPEEHLKDYQSKAFRIIESYATPEGIESSPRIIFSRAKKPL